MYYFVASYFPNVIISWVTLIQTSKTKKHGDALFIM